MAGLATSLVALLVAEACNIGLTPVTNPHYPQLTRSRLSHVDQNYLRGDMIAAANATLMAAQAQIPLAQHYGVHVHLWVAVTERSPSATSTHRC